MTNMITFILQSGNEWKISNMRSRRIWSITKVMCTVWKRRSNRESCCWVCWSKPNRSITINEGRWKLWLMWVRCFESCFKRMWPCCLVLTPQAYRNFGNRLKSMKKKLDELTTTLPSPMPSPDINAPSPEPDMDLQLPDDQSFFNVNGMMNSYMDGNLPFDINDFRRDSPTASAGELFWCFKKFNQHFLLREMSSIKMN